MWGRGGRGGKGGKEMKTKSRDHPVAGPLGKDKDKEGGEREKKERSEMR